MRWKMQTAQRSKTDLARLAGLIHGDEDASFVTGAEPPPLRLLRFGHHLWIGKRRLGLVRCRAVHLADSTTELVDDRDIETLFLLALLP
jgi:hypothetical protein